MTQSTDPQLQLENLALYATNSPCCGAPSPEPGSRVPTGVSGYSRFNLAPNLHSVSARLADGSSDARLWTRDVPDGRLIFSDPDSRTIFRRYYRIALIP